MADSIIDDAEVVLNDDTNFDEDALGARIKVFGIGGGGGNAVQFMIDSGLTGVHFICANTDKQALNKSTAEIKLQLGEKLTKGRGAGANPKVGREAAMESINAIRDAIGDAEMLFVTAGMGGGTGTGGAAVVAQVAREMNVLTVGVVTKPFGFEGPKRKKSADDGLTELKQYVDCLITIPNDRLLSFAPKKASFIDMLQKSNEVLYNAVKGISDVVNADGMINLDFADVRTTMSEAGLALMGTGKGNGENRARDAAQKAISSPLLEDVSLDSAKAILYNITASRDITTAEVDEIGRLIHDSAPADCNIIFGMVYDENIGDDLYVTLIATGIEPQENLMTPEIENTVQGRRGEVIDFSAKQRTADSASQDRFQRPFQSTQQRPMQQRQSMPQQQSPMRDFVPQSARQQNEGSYANSYSYRQRPMQSMHTPGENDFSFEDESDIPTWIRKQAD
ncbi:MAG: cell division protein FtsZ [Desulfovibrio sp.]|nr:cell division protein FtsZ [Desulfovibrio sp.]